MKKGVAFSIIALLATCAICFGALYFTNNASKTAQIESLTADVEQKTESIESLTADVAEKGSQIDALNSDLAERDQQLETLSADVTDKGKQIETLTADIADKGKQIETLTADVADKSTQIETLTADGAEKDGQIKTLKADVAQKSKQIESLTTDVAGKETEIAGLSDTISSQEKQITSLSDTVKAQEKQLDYPKMSEEELLDVVGKITPPLEKLGYTVMARNYSAAAKDSGTETSVDDAFVADLVKGLVDRWELSEKYDTKTMTDKQLIDYFSALVMSELDYISKYSDVQFEDSVLEEYAHNYISALQDQFIAISEYYGKDDAQYNEYWNNGYYSRAQMIYWINRRYGINVPAKHKAMLTEFIELGTYVDQYKTIERSLKAQLENTEFGLMNSDEWHVDTKPMTLKNDTAYFIESLTIYLNLYDADGGLLQKEYFYSDSGISAGKEIKIDSKYISTKFDHADYDFEFYVSGTVSGNSYYEKHDGSAAPNTKMGWNGTILKGGTIAEGQPVFEINDLIAIWDMNASWSKTLYVPTLRFSVKNIGDVASEKVTVHVVFTNNEKNEVWDEETVYVVGSSDGALQPGVSKKTFVYSSVGYDNKPTNVPKITAEIFVNGSSIKTVEIAR